MDGQIPTTVDKISIQKFVEEYIVKQTQVIEIESQEAFLSEDDVWLESTDYIDGDVIHTEYHCNKCGESVGTDDQEVFEHIKDRHPYVTGLILETVEDDVKYEDDEKQEDG